MGEVMVNKEENYDFVDFSKFIFSIFIIALHTQFLKSFDEHVNFFLSSLFFRLAVPYFFMISGFLFYNKLKSLNGEKRKPYLVKYIKRLSLIYLVWSLINAIFNMFTDLVNNRLGINSFLNYLKNIIFLRDGVLWYIQILIVGIIILYLCDTKSRLKILFITSIVLYLISVLSGTYNVFISNEIVKLTLEKMNLYLFRGLIFIYAGAFISIRNKDVDIFSCTKFASFYFLCLIYEIFLFINKDINTINNVSGYFLSLPFITYYLVLISLNIKITFKHSMLFRKMSMLNYFLHSMIYPIISQIFKVISFSDNNFILFISTVIISIVISFSIIKLSNEITFLKYFY